MIYLIALSLAADAVAVSVSNSLHFEKNKKLHYMPIYFGVFQTLMTLIGYIFGDLIIEYTFNFDRIIVFIVLGFIGCKMIFESLKRVDSIPKTITHKTLLAEAIATSIDALGIGISFSLLDVNIVYTSVVIGLVTYVLCLVTVKISGFIKQTKYFEVLAGIILIILAFRAL